MTPFNRWIAALVVLTLAFLSVTPLVSASTAELILVGRNDVPVFDYIPNRLTDLCYRPDKRVLAVCSDGGCGEFPLRSGQIVFSPPGFMSLTGENVMRGQTIGPDEARFCGVDNRGHILFFNREKLRLPVEITDVTGLTFDGKLFWVADRANNRLQSLVVKGNAGLRRVQTVRMFSHPGGPIEGITWEDGRIWTCDRNHVYMLNKKMKKVDKMYRVPVAINGIAFADGLLYATAMDTATIYCFRIPR